VRRFESSRGHGAVSLPHFESEVGGARCLDRARPPQFDPLRVELLEEPDAVAEEMGMDLHLVQQPGLQIRTRQATSRSRMWPCPWQPSSSHRYVKSSTAPGYTTHPFRHFPGSPSSNGDTSLPRQLWGWVSAGSRARCRRSSPSWVSAPARSPPNERDRRDPAPLGSHIAPVTSANYREAARLDRGRLGRRQSASTAAVVRRDRLARAPLHRPGEPSAQRVMATPPREVGCLAAHHPRSAQR
jgi:hypothetical protein